MDVDSDRIVKYWTEVSEVVLAARTNLKFAEAADYLRGQLDADADGVVSHALLLWLGDTLAADGDLAGAIAAYSDLVNRFPDRAFPERAAWAAQALELRAVAQEQAEDVEGAVSSYRELLERYEGKGVSGSWIRLCLARVVERAGRVDEAREAYLAAAAASDTDSNLGFSPSDLAARGARRLDEPGSTVPDPDDLGATLARALRARDTATLRKLASPTHFTLSGAAAERSFVETEKALDVFLADVARSTVVADANRLFGNGEKRYLPTKGWSGDLVGGDAFLLLAKGPAGWSWCGVVLTRPGKAWFDFFPSVEPEKNQPLPFSLRAPWQGGDSFRAGGLDRFLTSLIPVVGGFIFLADNFSPCGYGYGGFYYNAGSTHRGQDAFAIDFNRFQPGLPFFDTTDRQPVLAAHPGFVTMVRSNVASGDASNDNRVEIDFDVDPLALLRAILALFGITISVSVPPIRFRSKYLHLAGPGQVPVLPGMVLREGAFLGLMDDTGNSAIPHLHFSIHNRDVLVGGQPFGSVRPTPMDGQTLNDNEGGKCIASRHPRFR